jgi:hypothetical protein
VFDVRRGDIETMASQIIDASIEDGSLDQLAVSVSVMEKVVEKIRGNSRFVNEVRYLVETNGDQGGVLQTPNAKIELAEVGFKYDYSRNPMWSDLKKTAEQAASQLKAYEEFLRRIPAGSTLVDDDGVAHIGPAKSSTSSYKLTLL